MRELLKVAAVAIPALALAAALGPLSAQRRAPPAPAPARQPATTTAAQGQTAGGTQAATSRQSPNFWKLPAADTHMVQDTVVCPGPAFRPALDRILHLSCETEMPPVCAAEYNRTLVSAPLLPNRIVHDCQKLLKTPDTYGPLAALQPADWDSVVARFTRGPGFPRRGPRSFVIADILDYDTAQYAPLNIKPGLNCLVLQIDSSNPASVSAFVQQGRSCADPPRLFGRAGALEMKVIPYSDSSTLPATFSKSVRPTLRSRHPSTARWGWDGHTQFIGIHCGRAWCEFGPKGFKGSRQTVGDLLGLRDEQYLAEMDSSVRPPRLHPSHVWGVIQPEPILGTSNDADLAGGAHVATITLAEGLIGGRLLAAPPPVPQGNQRPPRGLAGTEPANHAHKVYFNRFKLRLLSPAVSFTEIWMKNVGPDRFDIATKLESDLQRWTPTVRCPWRHGPVGGVRWRWDSGDESVWMACTNGCCTAAGIN